MPKNRERIFTTLHTPKCVRSILCGQGRTNIREAARLFRVRIDCPDRKDGSDVPFIIIGDDEASLSGTVDYLRDILDRTFGPDEWPNYC